MIPPKFDCLIGTSLSLLHMKSVYHKYESISINVTAGTKFPSPPELFYTVNYIIS